MDVATWILVAILSVTLLVFLIVGILLMTKLLSMTDDIKRIVIKGENIAENANGVVTNVRGMTAIGGTIEMLVNKYINPRVKEKVKEANERSDYDRK